MLVSCTPFSHLQQSFGGYPFGAQFLSHLIETPGLAISKYIKGLRQSGLPGKLSKGKELEQEELSQQGMQEENTAGS